MNSILLNRKNSLRKKLISAMSLLIVSALMLTTASYAWFVMSTAPEVTGVETRVAANGALEIVLLNTETYNNTALLQASDIDENSAAAVTTTNTTWGNIVDLGSSVYGLSNVVLMPSRLAISQAGSDEDYMISDTLLKTPKYGEDGRILALESDSISAIFNPSSQAFAQDGGQDYGVRAIGTVASMSTFQREMNTARRNISESAAAAKTQAQSALQDNGDAIANIAVTHALSESGESYTKADIESLKTMSEGIAASLDSIEAAIRQVFVAYICSSAYTGELTEENLQAAKDTIMAPAMTLASLKTGYPGLITDFPALGTYIDTLSANQTKVANAISGCQSQIDGNKASYAWSDISGVLSPLADYNGMTLNGHGIAELQSLVATDINSAASLLLAGDGITVAVPTGSGLVSDIADFVGDYTAKVTVHNINYGGFSFESLPVTMETKTNKNPVYLTHCQSTIRQMTAKDGAAGSAITDFYGYAIDMAFKTNAAGTSKLLLQTDAAQRIYSDSTNAATMGGGSSMTFKTNAGLAGTKIVKLMKGLRVVFMDEASKVLSIAVLDCRISQSMYRPLTAEELAGPYKDTGFAYILDGSKTGLIEQYADCITEAEYAALPTNDYVVFDSTAKSVTAKLYLSTFHMTVADTVDENGDPVYEDEGKTIRATHKTGGLTIDTTRSDSVITSLEENQVKKVTALVYLDGSYVHNSEVAANGTQSMFGTLNLQFSSDAELLPAEITPLRMGSSAEETSSEALPETP